MAWQTPPFTLWEERFWFPASHMLCLRGLGSPRGLSWAACNLSLIRPRGGAWSARHPTLALQSSPPRQTTLFKSATSNPYHVLHCLLPPSVSHSHNLRPRPHNLTLPISSTSRVRNFIHRMIYKDIF